MFDWRLSPSDISTRWQSYFMPLFLSKPNRRISYVLPYYLAWLWMLFITWPNYAALTVPTKTCFIQVFLFMVLFLPVFWNLSSCTLLFYLKCITLTTLSLLLLPLGIQDLFFQMLWVLLAGSPRSYLAFLGLAIDERRKLPKAMPLPRSTLRLNTEILVVEGLVLSGPTWMAVMVVLSSGYSFKWFLRAPSETNQFPVSLPSPSAHSCFSFLSLL